MISQDFLVFTLPRLVVQLPLLIVGILALSLAGRASSKRGLIRTAGALLILSWLGFTVDEAALWLAPIPVLEGPLTTVLSCVIVGGLCGALILLLIALAFGGRGAAQPSAAEPRAAGGPAWGPDGPGVGHYGESAAPGPGAYGPGQYR
ncbi:hypothetical protein [Streptomonospora litoralis]|uniref:Uncharacterized protein n=1 Tax=Streptomonospora litoralis TaxID=2498135 RepID=A0A4P6PWE0_9ACTN|nr:hypothetical protein [Streptomonospora litoralis]QBI52393.1 hypothetical protein EKD16_02890 [Streptomonospora litoralis]